MKDKNRIGNVGNIRNVRNVESGNEAILTTDKYWDCECLKNFIHPKSQIMCYECGVYADNQPDSRVKEVLAEGLLL